MSSSGGTIPAAAGYSETIAQLRAENERLSREVSRYREHEAHQHRPVRSTLVVLLLVIGTLLAPLGVGTVWAHRTLLNTDQYVATVAPLSKDPAVEQAVANRISNELFASINLNATVASLLPPNAAPLAGPISNSIKSFTNQQIVTILGSQQFAAIWEQANRVAHTQITNLLLNKGGALKNNNGVVTLDLHELVTNVVNQLESQGFTIFAQVPTDKINGNITVLDSQRLATASKWTSFFNKVFWLPGALCVAAFAGAIWISKNRRRTLIQACVCVIAGMLIAGVAVAIGRSQVTNHAARADLNEAAASAVFSTLVRYFQRSIRAIVVLAAIVAVVAAFAGQSAGAIRARRSFGRLMTRITTPAASGQWHPNSAYTWVALHRMALRIAILLLVAVALVWWTRPTGMVVLGLAVIAGVAIFAIEVMARAVDASTTTTVDLRDRPAGSP